MRHIKKGTEPKELTQFRAKILATPGVGPVPYDEMTQSTKGPVLQQCLEEQGYLCAYTGLRIEANTSHLEHMYPRSHGSPAETISYVNLVACYPGSTQPNPGYGALEKGDWPDVADRPLFVRPTELACEQRFTYDRTGNIQPSDANDTAAASTTKVLKLQHPDLKYVRNEAWSDVTESFISPVQLRARLRRLDVPVNGRLEPLLFVKKQALEQKLKKLRRFH